MSATAFLFRYLGPDPYDGVGRYQVTMQDADGKPSQLFRAKNPDDLIRWALTQITPLVAPVPNVHIAPKTTRRQGFGGESGNE